MKRGAGDGLVARNGVVDLVVHEIRRHCNTFVCTVDEVEQEGLQGVRFLAQGKHYRLLHLFLFCQRQLLGAVSRHGRFKARVLRLQVATSRLR